MSFIKYFLTFCVCMCTTNAEKVIFQNVSKDITDNIFLFFIQGPSANDYVKIKLEDGFTLSTYKTFDTQRETVFHFPGWRENPDAKQESIITLASAFLQRNSVNFVVFDYATLTSGDNVIDYIESFINASYIGDAVGQYLQQYIPAVQSNELVHLLSHSLGSQIMSKTARTFGAGYLEWLTGLDPAGPLFNIPGVEHLTQSDAKFVDVIHTDGGFYGDFRSIGSIDFYPNRGTRIQPHCLTINVTEYCDHHTSWRYYAESIVNPTALPALKCFRTPLCDVALDLCACSVYGGQYTYMGYNVNKKLTGNFYMKTNAETPYGQGLMGMDF